MDGFIGGIILGEIGSFIKWCFYNLVALLTKKNALISYKGFKSRKEKVNDYDAIFLGFSDLFVGILFIALILILIYFFY